MILFEFETPDERFIEVFEETCRKMIDNRFNLKRGKRIWSDPIRIEYGFESAYSQSYFQLGICLATVYQVINEKR
jgi:hypothetical protein